MSKGVSEIVSQILMILLVLTIGTVILTYSMGYFSSLTGANDLMNRMNEDTLKERFIIVNVEFLPENDVNVSVYNYGGQNIQIVALYIKGESVSIDKTIILPGEFRSIYGNYTNVFNQDPFSIRVISSLGNYYENIYHV